MKTEPEMPVWVVVVVCRTFFKWSSKYANDKLTAIRTIKAETEQAAKVKAASMVKLHWETEYSGSGLKNIQVDWTYAKNISKGNQTEPS